MPTFRETVDVLVDVDAAWKTVGDLVSVDRWVPGLVGVAMYGSTRVCSFADGNVLREEIIDYRPDEYSYRYTIEGGLPVRNNTGQLSVQSTQTGSRVVLDSTWDAIDPAAEPDIAQMWSSALPTILARLATAIEATAQKP